MKVRYSYLPEQFSNPEPIFDEIRKHLKKGQFTLGPEVQQFEKAFASLIGTRFAVGVGSGTDALKLPMKVLGIGHGDEVITAANTFIATAGAIAETGARPVFVDVTPYFTLDPKKLEAAITSRTKAIMPVHLTGEPADIGPILEIARRHNLVVIEDACQAILASTNGKNAGNHGIAAGFSLHPLKNLNVWGDAGVVVTNDQGVYEKLLMVRNHGMINRDEIGMFPGCNSRLDSIQAIVGNWLLPQTAAITEARIANGQRYDEAFSKLGQFIRLPPRRKEVRRVFHLYIFEVIEEKHRNSLVQFLLDHGVDGKVHYPIPLYQQAGLKHLGYQAGDFPETDRQARHIVSLPVDQHLSRDQVDYTIATVQKYFMSII